MPFAERHPKTTWMPELAVGITNRFKEIAFVED
jgi:hypothetical protein